MAIIFFKDKITFSPNAESNTVFTLEKTPFGVKFDGELRVQRAISSRQGQVAGFSSGGISPTSSPTILSRIDRFSFIDDGNSTNIGSLTTARSYLAGCSSKVNGYSVGGWNPPSTIYNIIDSFPFSAVPFVSSDIGDLSYSAYLLGATNSDTHGYSMGGGDVSPVNNEINKFPFVSFGNATDIADLTVARGGGSSHFSVTHGYYAGGRGTVTTNAIDKFPFSVDLPGVDVADLSVSVYLNVGTSSATDGYSAGGSGGTSVIDKFSFSFERNATDVGALSTHRNAAAGSSSITHGYASGGSATSTIEKFPFAVGGSGTAVGSFSPSIVKDGSGGHQY
jgi:hypothetical protein